MITDPTALASPSRAHLATRTIGIVGAAWALPYIASKVHFALHGSLGVFGGPVITAADTARYGGAAAISQAQWGNVAVGVLIAAITLLPLTPFARTWNRWVRAVPVLLIATVVALMTLLFLIRVITGGGGLLFTGYLVVWSGLLWLYASRNLALRCSP